MDFVNETGTELETWNLLSRWNDKSKYVELDYISLTKQINKFNIT